MKNKMYWGLGVIIVLLIGVSAILFLPDADTEPIVVYKDVEPAKVNRLSAKKLKEESSS